MKKLLFILIFLAFAFAGNAQTKESVSLEKAVKVQLYPNPTVNYLNINLNTDKLKDVAFELYSLIGSKLDITIEKKADNHYKIPVDRLGAGYYLLIVKDRNQHFKKAYKFQKL